MSNILTKVTSDSELPISMSCFGFTSKKKKKKGKDNLILRANSKF